MTVEAPRTAIFVRGTHAGELITSVLKELMVFKRPNAISFMKKNLIHAFEDTTTLEFWAKKNDASLFLIGQSSKKRPHNLVFVRMFDNEVLDMCEIGIESFISMNSFKTAKSAPGHKPLLHFASPLFNTHARFMQLKSLLLSFFNGEVLDAVCLPGLEHVISVSLSPVSECLNTTGEEITIESDVTELPKVHVRVFLVKTINSGTPVPRVILEPMGPSLDLCLRRHKAPDPEMLKQALRQPKLRTKDVEQGLGKRRKNVEVDEMGDSRGRIHLGKQDLSRLKGRKMKGLRSVAPNDGVISSDDSEGEQLSRKRRKGE